mmetsp:Transcript_5122/g.6427  ORF Transcript_5122/g.6427 Transcript_5122/m.6427 type:complete len:184 (-) Transcript_5122:168-719(-)
MRGNVLSNNDASWQMTNAVMYFDRGGGVTFAQDALAARRAGAATVIVGNNVSVWPYVMKGCALLMLKRCDAVSLKRMVALAGGDGVVKCCVRAKRKEEGCVVCRENFRVGDVVMRLPFCSHCFHEDCALMWLNRHNTCPFCRRELPTDDEEYERDRRRQMRTHGGAGSGSVGGNESQWESLFG